LEVKNEPMTKELILNLHSIITRDTLDSSSMEGKFRTNNDVKVLDNITGEVFYDPSGYENVDDLINSFCEFANSKNENEFIHPISRGIILHFLIGYIHPFVDGNGRTARAIFYWYLISKNYWLIEYMSISRIIVKSPAKYARAYLYSEYDENDLTYFIEYNLKAMDMALKSLKEYISRKIKEKQSLYAIIRNENINERQAEILKSLIVDNQKSLTIREVQSKFGIVYQTARTDLLGLGSLGYLKEKKFGKKLVFFRAADFEDKVKKISATPFEELRN
jgi:Fic family protein